MNFLWGITKHPLCLCLPLQDKHFITIISANVPTMEPMYSPFYSELKRLITSFPNEDDILAFSDLNVRVERFWYKEFELSK